MANITRNQIKRRVQKLIDKLEEVKCELCDLQMEVEEESEDIEPYEGKDELTPQQEERQEWLEDKASYLVDQLENLEELISYLEEITFD